MSVASRRPAETWCLFCSRSSHHRQNLSSRVGVVCCHRRGMTSAWSETPMDGDATADTLFFAGFRFDRRGGFLFQLDEDGGAIPIELGSRSIDLLRFLIDKPGELVSRDAIMKAVWPGRVVEEANLNVQISKLRHV